MTDLLFDALRVGHMLAFAVGIGAAAFLELQLVRRFRTGVDIGSLRLLLFGHDLIRNALIALWVTGAALLAMRLGLLDGAFSAKLAAKLIVVTLLTANMLVIDRFVIPDLFVYEGASLSEIPAAVRGQFGAVAGFSAGCWGSALLLGGIGRFKAMEAAEIAGVLLPIVAAATLAGAAAGFFAGLRPAAPAAQIVPGE